VIDVLPSSPRPDVDDVIDRVAADVTRGEPSPDFRARVMARIEARRPPYATWVFAAATAAAIIAIAILIAHPWQRRASPITTTVAMASPAIEPVAPSSMPSPSTTEPVVRESRAKSAAPAAVFVAQAPALPPIDPIEPITRDSIQPTKLSIPQLTVEPLVMPAVDDDGSIRDRR
jgi:hypothetical protein